jgi:hypothetical protein
MGPTHDYSNNGWSKTNRFFAISSSKIYKSKKLTIKLQTIVETLDISVEIYRPRAIDEQGQIITAPEAIAIGALSDISIVLASQNDPKWPVWDENNTYISEFWVHIVHLLRTKRVHTMLPK